MMIADLIQQVSLISRILIYPVEPLLARDLMAQRLARRAEDREVQDSSPTQD